MFIVIIGLYIRLYLFLQRQSKRAKQTESYTPTDDLSAPWPTPITLDQLSPLAAEFDKSKEAGGSPRRSSVTYAPLARADSLSAKLAQYQIRPDADRKGSKDSDATLVLENMASARARLAVRRSLSRPEMAIREAPEDGIAMMQDSDAILNNDSGFERQLEALNTLSPGRSPRIAHAGFNSPRPAESDSFDHLQVPQTSEYRFPALAKQESGSIPSNDVSPEVAMLPNLQPIKTQESVQRSTTKGSGPSTTEGRADIGLWEALAATEPVEPVDRNVKAYLATGRRMSASEENRRASYLMIAYPMAVSSGNIYVPEPSS